MHNLRYNTQFLFQQSVCIGLKYMVNKGGIFEINEVVDIIQKVMTYEVGMQLVNRESN